MENYKIQLDLNYLTSKAQRMPLELDEYRAVHRKSDNIGIYIRDLELKLKEHNRVEELIDKQLKYYDGLIKSVMGITDAVLLPMIKKDYKNYADRLGYLLENEPDEMGMIVKYGHILSILERYINIMDNPGESNDM